MTTPIPPDPLRALRESYEAAVLGGRPPTGMVVNGAVLNAHAPAPTYDPDKAYLVTPGGIYAVD